MALTDDLKAFYFRIEDGYYAVMDWLEKQVHAPVYKYFVNPIENRGIPSFPVAILAVIAIIAVLAILFAPPTTTVSATVFAAGQAQPGVPATITVDGRVYGQARTQADGVVTFQGIPTGRTATLLVSKPGFAQYQESFDVGTEGKVLTVNLQSVVPERSTLNVRVTEEDKGTAISSATVSYFDSESGATQSAISDESGIAKITVPANQIVALKASKSGYDDKTLTANATAGVVTIKLRPKNTDPSNSAAKASVLVTIKDSDGNTVPSRVYLYSDKKISPEATLESSTGEVYFDKLVEEGSNIFVIVQPTGSAADAYQTFDGTGDTQIASSTRDTEFRVTMQRKDAAFGSTHSTITVKIIDESGAAIQDALLTMFFTNTPDKARLRSTTNTNGQASFVLAKGVNAYITASHEDYLPACAGCAAPLQAGDSSTITLPRAVIGNYGSAEVSVVDEDGVPVSGADVDLFNNDGFYLGAPREITDGNGIATFEQLPLTTNIKARAAIDARDAESDVFNIDLGEPAQAQIKLGPAQGTISVTLKDATTKSVIDGTVNAFEGNLPVAQCTTTGGSCNVKVRANAQITIRADAASYVSTTSEQLNVGPKQTIQKSLPLVPASLRNNLSIVSVDIQRNGRSAQAADRGATYDAIICANLPGDAQEAGIYVRASDKQSEQEDFVTILNPSNAAPGSSSIYSASTNTPGGSCSNDYLNQQASGNAKWFTAVYQQPAGVYCVDAQVLIKPTAQQGDKLNLYYRAYARKNDVYVRTPEDSELGISQRTALKDECYAQTSLKSIPIQTGTTSCTNDGCISVSYSNAQSSGGRGFNVPYGTQFVTRAEVRLVAPSSVELPTAYLKVSSPDNALSFGNYQGTPATIPSGNANGNHDFQVKIGGSSLPNEFFITTDTTAQLVNPNSRVRIEFGDSRGAILSEDSFVSVTGPGRMVVSAIPPGIAANQRIDVYVTLQNDIGQPITDASVFLKDAQDTQPLDGHELEIQGDNTKDNGQNGVYRFRRVKATTIGFIDVMAKREGFADAFAPVPIQVRATDFLLFEPEEVGIEEDCKVQGLKVVNTLDTRVTVRATYEPCVTLRSAQATTNLRANSISFALAPRKAKTIQVEPYIPSNACNIHFEATANGYGTTFASQDVPASNACQPKLPPNAIACMSYEDCPTQEDCDCLDRPAAQTTGSGVFTGKTGTPQSKCLYAGVCSCKQRIANKYQKRFEDSFFQYFLGSALSQGLGFQKGPQPAADSTGITIKLTSAGLETQGTPQQLTITPLIPYNALAITFDNSFSTQQEILSQPSSSGCFQLRDVSNSGIEKSLSARLIVPANGKKTIAAVFSGQKCLTKSITSDGKFKIGFSGAEDQRSKTFDIGAFSIGGLGKKSYSVAVNIVGNNPSKLALILTPGPTANITARAEPKLKESIEPLLLVNNIALAPISDIPNTEISIAQTETVNVKPGELPSEQKLVITTSGAKAVASAGGSPTDVKYDYAKLINIAPDLGRTSANDQGFAQFDSVGSLYTDAPTLERCRDGYCTRAITQDTVKALVNEELKEYVPGTFTTEDKLGNWLARFSDAGVYALYTVAGEMCRDPDYQACTIAQGASAQNLVCDPTVQVQAICQGTIGDKAWFVAKRKGQVATQLGISGIQAACNVALIGGIAKASSLAGAMRLGQNYPGFVQYQTPGMQGFSPYQYNYYNQFQPPTSPAVAGLFGTPFGPDPTGQQTESKYQKVSEAVPLLTNKITVNVPERKAGADAGTQLFTCDATLQTGNTAPDISCKKTNDQKYQYVKLEKDTYTVQSAKVTDSNPGINLATLNKYKFNQPDPSLDVMGIYQPLADAQGNPRFQDAQPSIEVRSCYYEWQCTTAKADAIGTSIIHPTTTENKTGATRISIDGVVKVFQELKDYFTATRATTRTLKNLVTDSSASGQWVCNAVPVNDPSICPVMTSSSFLLNKPSNTMQPLEKTVLWGTKFGGDAGKIIPGQIVVYASGNALIAASRPPITIALGSTPITITGVEEPSWSNFITRKIVSYLANDAQTSLNETRISSCYRAYDDKAHTLSLLCPPQDDRERTTLLNIPGSTAPASDQPLTLEESAGYSSAPTTTTTPSTGATTTPTSALSCTSASVRASTGNMIDFTLTFNRDPSAVTRNQIRLSTFKPSGERDVTALTPPATIIPSGNRLTGHFEATYVPGNTYAFTIAPTSGPETSCQYTVPATVQYHTLQSSSTTQPYSSCKVDLSGSSPSIRVDFSQDNIAGKPLSSFYFGIIYKSTVLNADTVFNGQNPYISTVGPTNAFPASFTSGDIVTFRLCDKTSNACPSGGTCIADRAS
ncbi:MAG TPA: carboxypeptidase-like regulatory domain-containing protein [Candidatus Norongarragalinales archaeon]|jgi:hypothetical protein|nr:carboxypeptidase-like regulatory domain-containing protein [Candidatus Norongarragalinales archaeon]